MYHFRDVEGHVIEVHASSEVEAWEIVLMHGYALHDLTLVGKREWYPAERGEPIRVGVGCFNGLA